MNRKMLSIALLFGILVLSLSTAQATPSFTLAEDVGVQVGDTWSYDIAQGSDEDSWPVDETDFIEPFTTAYGALTVIVHIDYLDYWEFSYVPERSVANISFGIGDLSQSDISHIEIRSSYAYVCNRTWDYDQQEYVRDTILGSLTGFDIPNTNLYSYDNVQINGLGLWWYWGNIDSQSYESDAYLEFWVMFRVHDKYSADYEPWGWYSAPFDDERPNIDINKRGTHDQTGTMDMEVTAISGDIVSGASDLLMTNSWGDVMMEYTDMPLSQNMSAPWTTTQGFMPFIQSTDSSVNEDDFIDAMTIAGADYDLVLLRDIEVLGLLTPCQSFHYWLEFFGTETDVVADYSSKTGVLIYVFLDADGSYQEASLASASFEFAYTEPNLSMVISQLNYAVDTGSSFDVDCIVLNDGDLAGDFSLELVGTGFSGSYSGTAKSGQTEVTMTIAVGADLDAGTYNINVRLVYDGTPVDNKDIAVQVNVATTTPDGGLTTDGVAPDFPIALVAVGGIILTVVVIVVLSKRKKN